MQEGRCPLCLQIRTFDPETVQYCRFQNTERLVCAICQKEIENHMRPTWQIIAGRVFPRSTRNQ